MRQNLFCKGIEPRGLGVWDAFDFADVMGESFLDVCALSLSKMRENLKTQQAKKENVSPEVIEISAQIAKGVSPQDKGRKNGLTF